MASISGGQFQQSSEPHHLGSAYVAPNAGQYSLNSISANSTVAGGGTGGGGTDTVTGVHNTSASFSGQVGGGGEPVITQAQVGGNTVLNLPDGSSITVVGVPNISHTFLN